MENSTQPQELRRVWHPVKQNVADTYLLILLTTYGATVLLVRTYLQFTGYPQVGDSTFHIAHLLWGGLLLFGALVMLLLWANPWFLSLGSVLGGIGAGLFIDEVGKFITQKNDYFFPLAFPIIYAVALVGVWLYFRVRRSQPRDARTLLYHALQDLKHVLDADLDQFQYAELIETLNQAIVTTQDPGQKDLARDLLDFVESRDIQVERQLHWTERLFFDARRWLSEHPSRRILQMLLVAGFALVALMAVVKLSGLLALSGSGPLDVRSLFSKYVIVNGKSSYEVDDPALLILHTLFVLTTGALALVAAILMGLDRDRAALRLGVPALVLALTVVNLLTFYFNQLYAMADALVEVAVVMLAQLYRWRFLPHASPATAPAKEQRRVSGQPT